MPKNHPPNDVIIELLGRDSTYFRDPKSEGYVCPFTTKTCIKKSAKVVSPHYPVCTLKRHSKNQIISVCPKRFASVDILSDVLQHAWIGNLPSNPRLASEVKMKGFGNVDYVVADIDGESVNQFVSVEVQAVDITGSVAHYFAKLTGEPEIPNTNYNFNFRNVSKRYLSQLIAKGHYHAVWKSRIVAIVQAPLYDHFQELAPFQTTETLTEFENIVFMIYDFEETNEGQKLVLQDVKGTHHNSIQNAVMYKEPPNKKLFKEKIFGRLI